MKVPYLSYNLDKKAFSVFREWTKAVDEIYPKWDIAIKSEQEILNSFNSRVLNSLEDINKEEPSKKNLLGWCVGYLKGNLTSRLSILWSNKYLNKPEGYHNVLWLKSIIRYLDVDELTLKRVNRLYKYLQENNFPFKELDEDVKKDEIIGHHILSDLEAEDNWKMNKNYLENMLYDETIKMLDEQREIEIPDLDEYFLMEELEELISKNPFEKKS